MRRLFVLFNLGLCACGGVQFIPPATPAPRQAQPVAAPFDTVWNAVIDYFAAQVIPIETLDRSSGFIVASRAHIPTRTKADTAAAVLLADCGKYPKGFNYTSDLYFLPSSAKYNIVVRPAETSQSTLLVTAKFMGTTTDDKPADCTSKGLFERSVEAAVTSRVTKQ
jgi:hypothetical protein